ncbi:MAG: hypothetical protein ACK4TA_02750 [Saprospiraceae bacterium]
MKYLLWDYIDSTIDKVRLENIIDELNKRDSGVTDSIFFYLQEQRNRDVKITSLNIIRLNQVEVCKVEYSNGDYREFPLLTKNGI